MILEMGFANTLNSIMNGLPEDRQTMLFSATLSKNIQELGRLSLKVRIFNFQTIKFITPLTYSDKKNSLLNSSFCMQ